ncbi:hypothetical protein M673_21300 (plasmid) [Aureimonas sp. AU20]|nr:hypothetical protein M673_21300 [Aureimonas sp. AU20]
MIFVEGKTFNSARVLLSCDLWCQRFGRLFCATCSASLIIRSRAIDVPMSETRSLANGKRCFAKTIT